MPNENEPVKVLVTGAAGQIGYALAPMIAKGCMLGSDTPVVLHLLDIPQAQSALNALHMELVDSACSLVKGIKTFTDANEACKDVGVAVMVGGFPRKEGMERADLIEKNVHIYQKQAKALNESAKSDCKILVVANPANTNAFVVNENTPNIDSKNITCLARLDHNRVVGHLANELSSPFNLISKCIVWGNHSGTQYPDTSHAVLLDSNGGGGAKVSEKIGKHWLRGEFVEKIQGRGSEVIKERGASSALSAANGAVDHMKEWVEGSRPNDFVSMGVVSKGQYGVPEGLVCSMPVTCSGGQFEVVKDLEIDDFSRKKIDESVHELKSERDTALSKL